MPVFNDGNMLEKSIASFINQTLTDIELICVNDGSTDNSLEVLNDYAKQYDSIRVLSQENQGSGKARNYGISQAQGEYIGFLDADDFFIDDDALEKLYDVAKQNDALMVSGNIKLVDDDGNYSPFIYLDYFTDYGVIPPEEYGIPWSFYKNIYRKDFLQDNNIIFPDLLRGQDPVFLAEILSKVDKVFTVPTDVYAYYYIDGAQQCNTFRKRFDHMMHYKMVFDYMSDSKFDEIRHIYLTEFLGFFNMLGEDAAEDLLASCREIFKDDPDMLEKSEEYFYLTYQDNPRFNDLINEIKNKSYPRITIISKIKNSERYLEKSLKNLLSQKFDDFELICINDNSTDNSLRILKKIAKNDSRVRIIDNESRDYISAYRKALDMSRGDYVLFFNPSFRISLYILTDLYKSVIINEADVVMFEINEDIRDLDGILPYNFDEIIETNDIRLTTFSWPQIKGHILNTELSPWFKFYRKDFLLNSDCVLDPWNPFNYIILHIKAILKSKYLSYSPVSYYFSQYKTVPDYTNAIDIFKVIDYVESYLKDENLFDELEDEFNYFKLYQIIKFNDSSKSEEFFQLAKDSLSELEYDENTLPYPMFKKYKWILENESFKDYDVINSIDDGSKSYEEYQLKRELYDLKAEREELSKDNKTLKKEIQQLDKFNKDLLSSSSWKVTKPLRKISNLKK